MDIRAGIITTIVLTFIGAIFLFRGGFSSFRAARKLNFYSLRRQELVVMWRRFLFGLVLLAFAIWLWRFGEPVAYQYFPPSPTLSLTPSLTTIPTMTISPTITLTPTITDTPSVSDTPTLTSTPHIPPAVEALFDSIVTPNPNAAFSPLLFSTVYRNSECVAPSTTFVNPVREMWTCFSYDHMLPGVQWTALWIRSGEIVHIDTLPWDGATGGLGFSHWAPPPEMWVPAEYTVQFFVGLEFKGSGKFRVTGDPPTSTPSIIPSATPESTITQTPVPSTTPSP